MRLWEEDDRTLSDRMIESLIAFADTGDPKTPDIEWPAWSPDSEALIVIDEGVSTAHMDPARLDFMDQAPASPPVPPRGPEGLPRD